MGCRCGWQTVRRLASKVAKILRGKHKTNYTPHVDCGDNVIVLNARTSLLYLATSGQTKNNIWHTGYPGGQKSLTAEEVTIVNW